jgi:hypothetical protein
MVGHPYPPPSLFFDPLAEAARVYDPSAQSSPICGSSCRRPKLTATRRPPAQVGIGSVDPYGQDEPVGVY